MRKYRVHKYETWLPERPKKEDKKDSEKVEIKTGQQKRNEKFEF